MAGLAEVFEKKTDKDMQHHPAVRGQMGKRLKRPRIDLDELIDKARDQVNKASKAMSRARNNARNERRKKARVLRKAGQLSGIDLERIMVLKRAGLWNPQLETPAGDTGPAANPPVVSATGAAPSKPPTGGSTEPAGRLLKIAKVM